jgi:hypothetical protein
MSARNRGGGAHSSRRSARGEVGARIRSASARRMRMRRRTSDGISARLSHCLFFSRCMISCISGSIVSSGVVRSGERRVAYAAGAALDRALDRWRARGATARAALMHAADADAPLSRVAE